MGPKPMAKTKPQDQTPAFDPPGVPPDGQPVAGAGDDAKPPPFGTAAPAGTGDLPRVVPPLARAGRGERRYKVSAAWPHESRANRYVLAAEGDRAGAVACYCAAESLKRAEDGSLPDGGRLVVTELPD